MNTIGSQTETTRTAHEQIAQLARRYWEQAGQPTGRDLEFWLQAEEELRARPAAATTSQTAAAQTLPEVDTNVGFERSPASLPAGSGKSRSTPRARAVSR